MSQTTLAFAATTATFNFGSHAVRIIMRDGEPWFVASDVARALEYRDAEVAARHLRPHQKGVHPTGVPGQNLTIINESGLYRLVLRSRKPSAERFSDWVTGEVLPSIRKTGGYNARRYYYPLSSADPKGRMAGNACLTPTVFLDKRNRAPELELIAQLEAQGHDVMGAKVRILALHDIARQAEMARMQAAHWADKLRSMARSMECYSREQGRNVMFTRKPSMNDPLERYVWGWQLANA